MTDDRVPIAATDNRDVDYADVTGWGVFKGHAIPVDVARFIAEKINLYHANRATFSPIAWMHPTAGWTNKSRAAVLSHCQKDGPFPVPLYAAPPTSAPADVVSALGWIVGSGDGRRWRRWGDTGPEWTEDREKAVRYARREDAESVHREDEDVWQIIPYSGAPEKHEWRVYNGWWCCSNCGIIKNEKTAERACKGVVKVTLRAAPAGDVVEADWRDDPSADERWSAGLDYGQTQLCAVLGVDPQQVNWDAATETLDGDVQAVIGNILTARFGDDWRTALSAQGWRTMDSAPKDGSRFLVVYYGQVAVCRWASGPYDRKAKVYTKSWNVGRDNDASPSLWQPSPPLPAPPAARSEGR